MALNSGNDISLFYRRFKRSLQFQLIPERLSRPINIKAKKYWEKILLNFCKRKLYSEVLRHFLIKIKDNTLLKENQLKFIKNNIALWHGTDTCSHKINRISIDLHLTARVDFLLDVLQHLFWKFIQKARWKFNERKVNLKVHRSCPFTQHFHKFLSTQFDRIIPIIEWNILRSPKIHDIKYFWSTPREIYLIVWVFPEFYGKLTCVTLEIIFR